MQTFSWKMLLGGDQVMTAKKSSRSCFRRHTVPGLLLGFTFPGHEPRKRVSSTVSPRASHSGTRGSRTLSRSAATPPSATNSKRPKRPDRVDKHRRARCNGTPFFDEHAKPNVLTPNHPFDSDRSVDHESGGRSWAINHAETRILNLLGRTRGGYGLPACTP